MAGNSLNEEFLSEFITSTPPEVKEVQPEDKRLSVDVTSNPKVTFSEAIDNTTVTGTEDGSCIGSVQLSGEGSAGCVIADLSLSTNGVVLEISPSENLSFSTTYTLKLTTDLTDLAGNPLASEYLSTFTTEFNTAGLADTTTSRLRGQPRGTRSF